jgi:hypothetical protein
LGLISCISNIFSKIRSLADFLGQVAQAVRLFLGWPENHGLDVRRQKYVKASSKNGTKKPVLSRV